jgi:hypothetical protein
MLKRALIASLLLVGATSTQADPGVFFGVTYAFGHSNAGLGLSLKVLSTNEQDHFVVGAGVSYYPLMKDNKFGVDVGVGYVFEDVAVTVGWDFMHSPQIGIGYVDTEDDDQPAAPEEVG